MKVSFCPGCGETPPPNAIVCPRCNRVLVAAEEDPLVGAEVGSYRVLSRLGLGGMGTVYGAVEKNIDKKVAIKIVHPHLLGMPELPTLLAEAKAVNAIGDRGIVDVHGFGALPDGRQYLVMERLEGESLDVLLAREKRLPLAQLVTIGSGILSALEAAHAAGFVHRDIKPANVFVVRSVRGESYVKLLDFGLATGTRVRNRLAVGTPEYASPEQAQTGAALGPPSDLYSVGCVLFEAATGHPPFSRPDVRELLELHRLADRPHLKKERPELPAALDALVASMMAIDPAQRPASAAAAKQALEALAPRRRSRAWAVAAAAVVLAGAVTAWFVTRPAPAAVTVPGDPLEQAVARMAADVRAELAARRWPEAYDKLEAAERSFPGRREWKVQRLEAQAALWAAAADALERRDVFEVQRLLANDPPPEGHPLAKALERAAFAVKNGMVHAGGVWIDAYEYPNRAEALPVVQIDWNDAVKLCADAKKHLCTEDEWERACTSAKGRCHKKGKVRSAVPAGSFESCKTPEGVHDLIGNVAEWTASPLREGKPQRVIRGGSFGQSDVQLSCKARDYYLPGLGGAKHIGFRCCL